MKSKILSIRLTEHELQFIKERAQNSGINVSTYVKEAALSDKGLTLSTKQSIYRELQIIRDSVTNKISSQTILKGCDQIWQLLK